MNDQRNLRDQIAERAAQWASIYPLANWPNWGRLACDGADDSEHLTALADKLAAKWGDLIADAMLAVVQPELDRLAEELRTYDTLRQRNLDAANEAVKAMNAAAAERDRLRTAIAKARKVAIDWASVPADEDDWRDQEMQRSGSIMLGLLNEEDAGETLAERDQLRDAIERVRAYAADLKGQDLFDVGAPEIADEILAALDQLAKEDTEPVERTIEEALDIVDGQFAEDQPAKEGK